MPGVEVTGMFHCVILRPHVVVCPIVSDGEKLVNVNIRLFETHHDFHRIFNRLV